MLTHYRVKAAVEAFKIQQGEIMMSKETKKIELTEQELDQVAGGKAGGKEKGNKPESTVSPLAGKASKEQQD